MMLIAYLVFVAATFPLLFARDRLFGLIYALLFLYSFPALFGYLYMPGYSESLNAYFGDEVGRIGLNFVFASMALIFLMNMALYRRAIINSDKSVRGIPVIAGGNRLGPLILWALLFGFVLATAANFNELSWYIAELDNIPPSLSAYLLVFKMSTGLIVVCYAIIRLKLVPQHRQLWLPLALYAIFFQVAAAKLGNRTDPAGLIVGIGYFETATRKIQPRTVLVGFLAVALAATLLTVIEMTRYHDAYTQMTLSERIIKNDYFAPAHVMLGAIAYNFVDPSEVIRSNFANALIQMQYPLLQKPVMDLFVPGVASRSASYAFYIFTEGFMFMGLAGFIYNAVIVTGFVKLWNLLGCTDDARVNLIIRSILATMAINVVRGQSGYFMKYLYMFFLPVVAVALILIGVRLVPRVRVYR